MQSILGGAVITLFLIALYAPWFTKHSMLVAIVGSVLVNIFLMAGCSGLLPHTGVSCSYLPACLRTTLLAFCMCLSVGALSLMCLTHCLSVCL